MPSILLHKPDPYLTREHLRGPRRLLIWLPPLVAVTIIAFESTGTFSAEHTSGWLRPIFEQVFGHLADPTWDALHHDLRKTGHFNGYGLACLSFLWSWLNELARRAGLTTHRWRTLATAAAIACTAAVASLDEWHQTFLPSRTGLLSDALLDTCGATSLCLLIALTVWRE